MDDLDKEVPLISTSVDGVSVDPVGRDKEVPLISTSVDKEGYTENELR